LIIVVDNKRGRGGEARSRRHQGEASIGPSGEGGRRDGAIGKVVHDPPAIGGRDEQKLVAVYVKAREGKDVGRGRV